MQALQAYVRSLQSPIRCARGVQDGSVGDSGTISLNVLGVSELGRLGHEKRRRHEERCAGNVLYLNNQSVSRVHEDGYVKRSFTQAQIEYGI